MNAETARPWLCSGCAKPYKGIVKQCDCPTGCGHRMKADGSGLEHIGAIDHRELSLEDWHRLSRIFNRGVDGRDERDRRINEWLKLGISKARSEVA